METSPGTRLAMLLLNAFNGLVEEVVQELARRGHPGVTASLEFALKAIDDGADSASRLGHALGVSKQAAAKTIVSLENLGYVDRIPDRQDARRVRLRITSRGQEMTRLGRTVFDDLRRGWAETVGPNQADAAERALSQLLAGMALRREGER